MLVTDLDGTLLRSDRTIAAPTLTALHNLSSRDVVRVVATGRSLGSALSVLPENTPLDFLIFSSGAGIVEWGAAREAAPLLSSAQLTADQLADAVRYCLNHKFEFMIHEPAPHCHRFGYLASEAASGTLSDDLSARIARRAGSARALERTAPPDDEGPLFGVSWTGPACQVVALPPPGDHKKIHADASAALPGLLLIRTTSPIDGESLWLEFFPPEVSKGHASHWLAERLEIPHSRTLAVGNDYNDLGLLTWAKTSVVVSNAPQELRDRFHVVPSNDQDGILAAIELMPDREA